MPSTKSTKKPPLEAEPPTPARTPLESTADLFADAENPRKISEAAAAGLRESLKRFGDLSGIVWNLRTGELVCGHQRVDQIRAEFGDRPIEVLDAAAGIGRIRIDDARSFTVRIVDWPKAKQRAANVTANNQKIAGKFTDQLADYLLPIADVLDAEEPGLFDAVLLTPLLSASMDLADATEPDRTYDSGDSVSQLEPSDDFAAGVGEPTENGVYGARVVVGSYKIQITVEQFEAWEAAAKAEVGPTKEAVCELIARRLGL